MRIVCVSDTHNRTDGLVVPDGDVLVHAGDLTGRGTRTELEHAGRWLASLPHPRKVIIAGNHDFGLQTWREARGWLGEGIDYLQDSEVTIQGVGFWGSPWQPWFHDWAFNLKPGRELRAKWALIPNGIDVLITHGPPRGILDQVTRGDQPHVGCVDLLERVQIVRPKLHVFGHIHEGYGQIVQDGTTFVNASTCTTKYQPTNPPIVFDLE